MSILLLKVVATIWATSGLVGLTAFAIGMSSTRLHHALDRVFKISWSIFGGGFILAIFVAAMCGLWGVIV